SVGHGGTDADGSEVHDEIGEAEHDLSERFSEIENGFLQRFGDASERDSEEDGEDSDLKNLVFGDGLRDIFRKNMEDEVGPTERSGGWQSLRDTAYGNGEAFT